MNERPNSINEKQLIVGQGESPAKILVKPSTILFEKLCRNDIDGLKKKGVTFRSLTESRWTRPRLNFGALAEYERALIEERVVPGLAWLRSKA